MLLPSTKLLSTKITSPPGLIKDRKFLKKIVSLCLGICDHIKPPNPALYLPKLNEAVSLKDFLKQKQDGLQLIAHCEETDKTPFKSTLKPDQDITILIGPEGDFSTKEIELAIGSNFKPVTLGESRLRTETAALAACHSVAFVNE